MDVYQNIKDGKYVNKVPYSRDSRKKWREEETKLEELFRADLEEEFSMKGHSKAQLLWNKAWEMGHASGLHEVCCYYSDLRELVGPDTIVGV